MGHSVREYLEQLETSSLQAVLEYVSRPKNLDEYDYVIPLIKEILKKRTTDTHP